MKAVGIIGLACAACVRLAFGADDLLDPVDDALAFSAFHDELRARLSGTIDLEDYDFQRPASDLFYTYDNRLFNPRLTVFLDAQIGPCVYVFAQSRLDHGFDPGTGNAQARIDEYALRFTPWGRRHLSLQIGKFATVVGNWVPRHHSWDSPFVTAPLPYDNLTGIFDAAAARSADTLLFWARVLPAGPSPEGHDDVRFRVPIIWGPSYTSGAALSGVAGRFDYAVEWKNASLSSRPEAWDPGQTQWQHPTFSGRIGYRPDEMWAFGLSASSGSYLRPSAAVTVAPGYGLDDYRETVLGQDLSFAWHHFELWAECYEARFAIPLVGNVDTVAGYVEAKYKFTPRFFGAVRWNQQWFGQVPTGGGRSATWGNDVWRLDVAPTYRFTAHIEAKLQFSLQHSAGGRPVYARLIAGQLVVRF